MSWMSESAAVRLRQAVRRIHDATRERTATGCGPEEADDIAGTFATDGALGFDPLAHVVDPDLASRVLWLDALVGNVDRSWRNPNLLLWHRQLQLIDHGATLVFAHSWGRAGSSPERPYAVDDHVLAGQVSWPAGHVEDQSVDPRGLRPVVQDCGAAPGQSPLYRCSRHGSPWLW